MANSDAPLSSFQPQPSDAEKAFIALQDEIDAFAGPLVRTTVDVQAAAAIAHSVVVRDLQPERFAWLERLADAELYDLDLCERVSRLSLATWFTRQRHLGRLALESAASVPADVFRSAQLQRRTMLKVVEHWLEDDPAIMAEAAVIREGAGYQDLANDLEALADLYQRPSIRAVIQQDRKHYRKTDVKTARTLARAVFTGLGIGRESDAKRWGTLCQRAWAMLLAAYDEHRAAGTFLFRKLEDVAETYPSLVSAARRSPTHRVADEQDEAGLDGSTPPEDAELPEAASA